jgi:hypothetical protein
MAAAAAVAAAMAARPWIMVVCVCELARLAQEGRLQKRTEPYNKHTLSKQASERTREPRVDEQSVCGVCVSERASERTLHQRYTYTQKQ